MKAFKIHASEDGLDALGERLLSRIEALFSVDRATASRLRSLLDSALRIWTTSLRGGAEAITREAAYEKLCLADDALIGEHHLAPPAPFFGTRVPVVKHVASLLDSHAAPVVFVVGEPGSGKTALISALANRRLPEIDLRFHAYRPITPQNQLLPADAGRTTAPRVLWSDLLIQIRSLARGRLSLLQVPVCASVLSVDALRTHVVRIAEALGAQEKRTFVIAIDGIDHAARSGVSMGSFLETLIPPDQVPPHVMFLLGGQAPEGYPSYPAWLRAPTPGVIRFELPRLSLADTVELVRTRLPLLAAADHENVARDIMQRSEGHTLSTVFAIEEAVHAGPDLSRLAKLLDERKLSSGVQAYYGSIWSAATRNMPSTTVARLAACLCLMPVRVTGMTVQAVLGSPQGTPEYWSDVLRQLRPLVAEDEGQDGFRLFHNDVRVFLLHALEADSKVYQSSASLLADHLMSSVDGLARHAAAQGLFGIGGRPADQAALYNPAYVLEGHALGRTLDELTQQACVAADSLEKIGPNWELAHVVATGLQTLEQLRKSLQWRGAITNSHRTPLGPVGTKPAERRVPPRTGWTQPVLNAALDDIAELYALGEHARALAAFERWFDDLSPFEIARAASDAQALSGGPMPETGPHLITKLGGVSATLGILLRTNAGESDKVAEAGYARGLLGELHKCATCSDFVFMLRRVRFFESQDIQKLLSLLAEERSWRMCGLLLQWASPDAGDPWFFRLSAAAVAALLGDGNLRKKWIDPVLETRVECIAGSVAFTGLLDDEANKISVMAWTALLLGLEEPYRDPGAIREEISDVYQKTKRDDRADELVSQILHAAALLGSFIQVVRSGRATPTHLNAKLVSQTARTLMEALEGNANILPSGFPAVASRLLRGFVDCAYQHAETLDALGGLFLSKILVGRFIGVFLETVWRTLSSTGRRAELVSYADRLLGSSGLAWSEAPAERFDIVTRLAVLLDEIGEHSRAGNARARLAWADIGYSGHKEYALGDPLEWFKALFPLHLNRVRLLLDDGRPDSWNDAQVGLAA